MIKIILTALNVLIIIGIFAVYFLDGLLLRKVRIPKIYRYLLALLGMIVIFAIYYRGFTMEEIHKYGPWFLIPSGIVLSFFSGWVLQKIIENKKTKNKKAQVQVKLIVLLFIVSSSVLFAGCLKKVERTPREAQDISQELKMAERGDFVVVKNTICMVQNKTNDGHVIITSPLFTPGQITYGDKQIAYISDVIRRKDRMWPAAAYNYITSEGIDIPPGVTRLSNL